MLLMWSESLFHDFLGRTLHIEEIKEFSTVARNLYQNIIIAVVGAPL